MEFFAPSAPSSAALQDLLHAHSASAIQHRARLLHPGLRSSASGQISNASPSLTWSEGPLLAAASAGVGACALAMALHPVKRVMSTSVARKGFSGATLVSANANSRKRLVQGRTTCRVFDRFRDDAITAVYGAQEEAIRRGSGSVSTELVLFGMLGEDQQAGNRIAKAALSQKGVTREALKRILDTMTFESASKGKRGPSLPFADDTKLLFDTVNADVKGVDVGCEHMLLGLTKPALADSRAVKVLGELGVASEDLRSAVEEAMGQTRLSAAAGNSEAQKELATVGGGGGDKKLKLSEVGVDLTQMAFDGLLDPVFGREEEMERVIQILLRKKKNNACLVGPPGVGKTAVAEGLAQRIADGKVPPRLRGLQVYSLDLGLLVAGTKYRGEFEERLQAVIEEATSDEHQMCLFIDEIHQLVGAGVAGPDSSMDAANMLKPALAKGDLRVIGATTLDEYTKYIEKDAALERRFQKVLCEEPSLAETEDILEGLRSSYEKHHGVIVMPEAIATAVRLSDRYIGDRYLPDKAIDLIDEAGSLVHLREVDVTDDSAVAAEAKPRVTASDVTSVLSRWSGVPVERLTGDQADRLMNLETALSSRVIGQLDAVNALSRAVRRSRAGLAGSSRPIASLYFAGPTGVGKTELCRVLADEYYSDPKAMIRLDMSEYSEQHSVSRLIGAPPGYVGYDDPRGGQLTEAVRRQPYSVVVFDEIEKAHKEVFNVLLQVLEDGRLTDGKGREVNFSNCMIVMTSNVGSVEILEYSSKEDYAMLRSRVIAQLQRSFRPEFLNRIDELLVFRRLGDEELRQIIRLTLRNAAQRAQQAHAAWMVDRQGENFKVEAVEIEWTESLEAFILDQGIDPSYGARPLRRAVQRFFEDPLAELLIADAMSGTEVVVDVDADDIVVRCGADVFRPALLAARDAGPAGVEAPSAQEDSIDSATDSTDQEVSPAVAVS
mmetsp:Transcript_52270/g.122370  ORF Transcript_52270/g.122370 Transcript_52270/m.122370 type:complete len:950 (-) Transcript_52270:76-2925(-)